MLQNDKIKQYKTSADSSTKTKQFVTQHPFLVNFFFAVASIYFVLINFFECIYERIQYVKCTCFLLSKKFSIRIDNKGKKSPPLVPAGLKPTNPKQILPQSLSSQALFPTTAYNITAHCSKLYTNISSVVEFQRWWVLKSKLFGQESTCHQGKIFKKIL